jgi:flagellar hook-associated protein 1 FlgK
VDKKIVDGLNQLYTGIDNQEEVAQKSLKDGIDKVNSMLQDIKRINIEIEKQGFASNDLLDKRDLLEKQISSYADVKVSRDNGFYELKIGNNIAVSNTTVSTLSLGDLKTPQVDRYVTQDGSTNNSKSSILGSSDNFNEKDKITFELDNQHSVSVEYGETMVFDLNGDGKDETVKVDSTNYVRALVHKINSNVDIANKVKAFNGNYDVDSKGNKFTIDSQDKFLVLEAKVPGVEGKFDSRITFTEDAYSTNEATQTVSPVINNSSVSINSKFAADGLSLTHSVNLGTTTTAPETFDIDLHNNYGTSGATPVFVPPSITYNATTHKITVPAGIDSFTIKVDSIEGATGTLPSSAGGTTQSALALLGATQEYTLSLTETSGSNTNNITSLLSVVNDGKNLTQDYTISTSSSNPNPLVSAIPTVNPATGATQASGTTQISSIKSLSAVDGSSITHTVELKNTTTTAQVMKVSFSDDTGNYFDLNPVFTPDTITYDATTKEITIPPGVKSFSFTTDTNALAPVNANQTYSFSITDNAAPSGATPKTTTSTLVINNKEGVTAKSVYKNESRSDLSNTATSIHILDQAVTFSSGSLKAITDNLTTDSGKNQFDQYKKALDSFAKTLADVTASYIKNDDGTYVSGEIATDNNIKIADDINLFSGSSVKTMQFNDKVIGTLKQKDYDYLSTIQWKKDVSFLGYGQDKSNVNVAADTETSSFSEFLQNLRTNVSRDKETSDSVSATQKAVTQSMLNTYDLTTKVNNDEEMVNLIKFQAAYSANAKMITTVDQMLQTLLGIKR